jgi:hypothetical protein
MSVVKPGHTLVTHGTLDAGRYLSVDAGYGGAPGGVLILTGAAENDGFVTIDGSDGPGDAAARVTIAPSGVLINNGDIIVGLGGGLSGDGVGPTIQIYGKLYNNNLIRFGEGYGGTPDTMTIASSGMLQNAGIFYLTGARGGPAGAVPGATLVDAGVLTNAGTLEFFGGYSGNGISGQGALLDVTSTGILVNNGLIEMKGAYGALEGGGGQGTSGTLEIAGNMKNFGVLQIEAANTYGGGYASSGSVVRLDGYDHYLNNYGMIAITGSAKGDGGGPPAGTLEIVSSFLDNWGTVIVGGGTDSQFGTAGGLGGSFMVDASGYVFDSGSVIVQGGQNGGAGGTMDLSGQVIIGYSAVSTVDLQAGASASGGGVFIERADLVIDPGSTINIAGGTGISSASMTLERGGLLYNSGVITGDGTLVNDGYIGIGVNIYSKGSNGPGVIAVAHFINDATVGVPTNGMLSILDGVSTSAGSRGDIHVYNGTLRLYGAVDAGQMVQLGASAGGNDTLALGDASLFSGVIDGLGTSTTLDFLKLDVTSASSSGDTLLIGTAEGGTISLALGGALDPGLTLHLFSDGAGGTDLTFG